MKWWNVMKVYSRTQLHVFPRNFTSSKQMRRWLCAIISLQRQAADGPNLGWHQPQLADFLGWGRSRVHLPSSNCGSLSSVSERFGDGFWISVSLHVFVSPFFFPRFLSKSVRCLYLRQPTCHDMYWQSAIESLIAWILRRSNPQSHDWFIIFYNDL